MDFINTYSIKYGFSPSFEEIKRKLKLHSISTIHQHLEELEKTGYLKKKKNQKRSINVKDFDSMIKIPLLGTIAAGQPIEAIRDKEMIAIPKSKFSHPSEIYALRVVGNSMIDENINDGDIVLVKQQETADNGQKVVALIDNHEVTLKKFYKERGHIRLQPANRNMEPLIFQNDRDVSIQGIVLDVIRSSGITSLNMYPGTKLLNRERKVKNREVKEKVRGGTKFQNNVIVTPEAKGINKFVNKIIRGDSEEILKNPNGFNRYYYYITSI